MKSIPGHSTRVMFFVETGVCFELNKFHCRSDGSVMLGDDEEEVVEGMVKVAESRWLSGNSGGVVFWGQQLRA
ncbi:hypothetical protein EUGRSUZ_A01150 [Eucalyptus grandis]|uniref:Uncharacterized protein n=2 Tax=Eucalyptus grandis TaxID=71139 RepID=A0ACC3M354_EUCGR|nr:hypothetical protein EUGRSUZ_A01150 [Eucalyptus grandis]